MNLLFTGASGFIGSEILARLLKINNPNLKISLLGRRVPEGSGLLAKRFIEHGLSPSLISTLNWIITPFDEPEGFRKALADLSGENWVVLHLAAVAAMVGDKEKMIRLNLGVTQDLLDWSGKHASKFIFASSVVAFGGSLNPVIRSESDFDTFESFNNEYAYFKSKREAQLLVQTFGSQNKLACEIFCPSIVQGSLDDYKESRAYVTLLRKRKLKLAPSGGGNLVSLDFVARTFVDRVTKSVDTTTKAKVKMKLLVERNIKYRDYFQEIVDKEFGENAPKIKTLPRFVASMARFTLSRFNKIFPLPNQLTSIAQGGAYLYFESRNGQQKFNP